MMRSPRRKPAVRAGPASLKPSTTMPSAPPLVCRPSHGRGRRLVTRPAAISSSFTGRKVSSGMARFTKGASPSRSETTPTSRPWPRAREAHHREPRLEIDADEQRGHHAAVAKLRLDGLGVDDEIADGDHVAARVEDHAAAGAARAQPL